MESPSSLQKLRLHILCRQWYRREIPDLVSVWSKSLQHSKIMKSSWKKMGTSAVGRFQKSKWQRKCIVLFCTYFLSWERGIWEHSERQGENYFKMPFYKSQNSCVMHFNVILRTRDAEETGKDISVSNKNIPKKPSCFGREQEETSTGRLPTCAAWAFLHLSLKPSLVKGYRPKGLVHKDNSNASMRPFPPVLS